MSVSAALIGAGASIVGSLFGGDDKQTTKAEPAPRTSELDSLWQEFMGQVFGEEGQSDAVQSYEAKLEVINSQLAEAERAKQQASQQQMYQSGGLSAFESGNAQQNSYIQQLDTTIAKLTQEKIYYEGQITNAQKYGTEEGKPGYYDTLKTQSDEEVASIDEAMQAYANLDPEARARLDESLAERQALDTETQDLYRGEKGFITKLQNVKTPTFSVGNQRYRFANERDELASALRDYTGQRSTNADKTYGIRGDITDYDKNAIGRNMGLQSARAAAKAQPDKTYIDFLANLTTGLEKSRYGVAGTTTTTNDQGFSMSNMMANAYLGSQAGSTIGEWFKGSGGDGTSGSTSSTSNPYNFGDAEY